MNEKNNEIAQSFAAAGTTHVNSTVEFTPLNVDLIGVAKRNEKGVEFLGYAAAAGEFANIPAGKRGGRHQ